MAQLLLPTLPNLDLPYRGVRAELYKLNIYSGPSGKFLSHVDTPRASTQFGSLVVCLSVEHEGGGLVVRHKGRSMTFNWSASNQGISTAPGIKWAAFYSDVEHEVLEVTSGHRVTLMYNLYVSQDSGMLNGICPNLSSQRIPLHGIFREAFMEPTFFPKGKLVDDKRANENANVTKEDVLGSCVLTPTPTIPTEPTNCCPNPSKVLTWPSILLCAV